MMKQASGTSPIWAIFGATGLVVLALASIMLAPYLTPPAPGRVTGILFPAGTAAASSLADILAADPTAQIIDTRLGGVLVFAVYHRPGFPASIDGLGAERSFDAIAAGCHGLGAASPLNHLAP